GGLPTHRYSAGVWEREKRWPRSCRKRCRAQPGVHHHQIQSVGEGPGFGASAYLGRLGVDYVDLYLIHWPQWGATWAWPAMERAPELGSPRLIGVSNCVFRELEQVLAVASKPPVNQIQFSPFEYRSGLLEAAQADTQATFGSNAMRFEPPSGKIVTVE